MKRGDRREAITMLKAANAAFTRESRPCASKAIEHAVRRLTVTRNGGIAVARETSSRQAGSCRAGRAA